MDVNKAVVEETIKELSSSFSNAFESALLGKGDNEAMGETVETYKKEYITWFDDKMSTEENAMSRTTQELWYSHYLEKRRLEKRGIRVHHVRYEQVPYNPGQEPETVFLYGKDGKYKTCHASQMTMLDTRYIRDDKTIGQEQVKRDITYYIVSAQNEQGLYICPNCGAEQELQQLLDGCDHCNTKYDISAYEDKIASVNRNVNRFETREVSTELIVWMVIGVITGGLTLLFFVMGFWALLGFLHMFLLGLIFAGICWLGAFACLIITIGVISGAYNSNRKAIRNSELKTELARYNPDFSKEAFIGSLDCKIKSIHYAQTPEELSAFVKCDISAFTSMYQNVISCEPGKISMDNYRQEGEFQYIDVIREVKILRDYGDHVEWDTSDVSVTLAKKKDYKLKNDVSIYQCPNCGASISLVEGGKCKYCDSEMDYISYDWIITNYEIVTPEKKKKE